MKFDDLSDEQQTLINLAKEGKNVLVDACIGSGKTTTIQVLCDELPHKKILYFTYNRLLKIDAKVKIQNKNAYVTNYHGFASFVLSDNKIELGGVSDLIRLYIVNFNRMQKHPSFDLLLIDEYQDIDEEIADMLTLIKFSNPNIQIIAVGDMNQKIYDKTTLNANRFMNNFLEEHELVNFTKCFRINADFANRLGKIWNKKIVGVNNNCEVKVMSFDQIISFVEKQNTSDILCVGSRTGWLVQLLNVLEAKHPEKFNKNTVYSSIQNEDRGVRVNIDNSVALFTTFDSSKGLERKICVIFDFTVEYWNSRSNQNNIRYEILRNVFCVAASRGKSHIIFADMKGSHLLPDRMLSTKYVHDFDYNKDYYICNMFEYNFKENIEKCFSLLEVEKDETEIIDKIAVKNNCGTIDISNCMRTLLIASFFKNYDIDKYIDLVFKSNHIKKPLPISLSENPSIEEKVLFVASIDTKQIRFMKQIPIPFVDCEIVELMHQGLSAIFDSNEAVQVNCEINLVYKSYKQKIVGLCDVLKDDIVWKIEFASELEHYRYLQCACDMIALNKEKGVIWNIRTNERVFITIPDRNLFMKYVAKSITKGVLFDVDFNIGE